VAAPGRGTPTAVRTLARAGLLRPPRPDRLLALARALRHWGPTYAGGFAAAAARHPRRPCVIDDRGRLTWADVDRRSNAIAHALARRGIRAGDVVGVACRNHRGFVEATAALAKVGADIAYLNTGFAGPQLREVLAREGAVALVADEEFVAALGDDSPVRFVILARGDAPGRPTLSRLAEEGPSGPPPAPERPGRSIILTSGTTGAPKGAPRPQTSGMGPVIAMLERIPYREGDTMVVPAPLFHSWGFGNLSLGLVLGATFVLRPHFDPEAVLADVARHRAQVLVAVPVMLQRILDLPAKVRARYDTSSLRIVPLSGSAIPSGLATRWMDTFGDNLYNLYGSTEVGWATIATPADLRADPATAGRPPLHTVVRVLDDENREVPPGVTGRIFVGSDLVFEGYTGGGSKPVVDGLMSTGDTGWFDTAGRLHVAGREDEMIVSGGENVFPREVEDLLVAHPAISEAAVVGVDDAEFGQRLRAVVVLAPGATMTAEEVRDHVRANLARFKVPRDVVFVDALPRNPTGKVLKRELR